MNERMNWRRTNSNPVTGRLASANDNCCMCVCVHTCVAYACTADQSTGQDRSRHLIHSRPAARHPNHFTISYLIHACSSWLCMGSSLQLDSLHRLCEAADAGEGVFKQSHSENWQGALFVLQNSIVLTHRFVLLLIDTRCQTEKMLQGCLPKKSKV